MIRKNQIALCFALTAMLSANAFADNDGQVRVAGGASFPGVPTSVVAGIHQNPPSGSELKPAQYSFDVTPGAMLRSNVSRKFLNRIVTPFQHPVVKTTSAAKIEAVGQTLFVSISPTQVDPIVLYVMEKGDTLDAVSVMLDPKELGPVEIDLKQSGMPGSGGPQYRFDDSKAAHWEQSNPYTDTLTDMMRQIAKGKVPPGYEFHMYAKGDRMPVCQQEGLSVVPKQVMEGHDMIAYVGAMTNNSDRPIEFQESACAVQGVLAVASWPGPLLQPHESSEVYIVVKHSTYGGNDDGRPSAIVGGAP